MGHCRVSVYLLVSILMIYWLVYTARAFSQYHHIEHSHELRCQKWTVGSALQRNSAGGDVTTVLVRCWQAAVRQLHVS